MQITLTITAQTPGEMATVLEALQASGVEAPVQLKTLAPVAEQVAPPVEAPPSKRGRPFGSRNAPSMLKAVEKAQAVPSQPGIYKEPNGDLVFIGSKPEPEAKKEVTVLDVRTALTAYVQANDDDMAKALLKKHGKCDRLSQLNPEYFEAVYNAAVTPVVKDGTPFDDDITVIGAG